MVELEPPGCAMGLKTGPWRGPSTWLWKAFCKCGYEEISDGGYDVACALRDAHRANRRAAAAAPAGHSCPGKAAAVPGKPTRRISKATRIKKAAHRKAAGYQKKV